MSRRQPFSSNSLRPAESGDKCAHCQTLLQFKATENVWYCPCASHRTATETAAANSTMAPWHPMADAEDLKTIGKLGEEAGELSQVICRCIIQGVEGKHPITKMPNREWLENEIADVVANIALVKERFGLDEERILRRAQMKMKMLAEWHKMA